MEHLELGVVELRLGQVEAAAPAGDALGKDDLRSKVKVNPAILEGVRGEVWVEQFAASADLVGTGL